MVIIRTTFLVVVTTLLFATRNYLDLLLCKSGGPSSKIDSVSPNFFFNLDFLGAPLFFRESINYFFALGTKEDTISQSSSIQLIIQYSPNFFLFVVQSLDKIYWLITFVLKIL